MNRLCFATGGNNYPEIQGSMIELKQQGKNRFSVRYGKQIDILLTYDAAALALGAAIMHLAACNGVLDNGG